MDPWSLLSPLFDFLTCLGSFLVGLLLAGLAGLLSLLLTALGALLALLIGLLPVVDLPTPSPPAFLAWVNWLFPMDQFVIACGVVAAVLESVLFHFKKIPMRECSKANF